MTDPALLSQLRDPDPLDYDRYVESGSWTPPPPPRDDAGRAIVYTGRAPKTFEWRATQDGYLMAVIDPITIIGPQGAGAEVRFTRASVKKFTNRRTGEPIEASMLGNYLRAFSKALRPQTNADYIRAVESTAGRTFQFTLDWEAYDAESGETVASSYEDFPLDADGQRQPFIDLPDGRRLFARARIARFVPAKE